MSQASNFLQELLHHEFFASPVEEWSGKFTELLPGFGVVVIDVADSEQHTWPEGWVALSEPIYLDCLEVWLLGKQG